MTDNILKITVGEAATHRETASDRLQRAVNGERGETIQQDAGFVLNFESCAEVDRLMRTVNFQLLETIVAEQPAGIRETADAVDREYSEVHRNLDELASLGVIEFGDGDNGGRRPALRGGAERIDFESSIDLGVRDRPTA